MNRRSQVQRNSGKEAAPTGSKEPPPDAVLLGRLLKAHGLKGELKFLPFGCDRDLLQAMDTVFLGPQGREVQILGVRGEGKTWIVALEGVGSRTEAEELQHLAVWVRERDLPPPPQNEIYVASVIDAKVVDENAGELGTVESVLETGENDVLIVRQQDGEEILIPTLRSVLGKWDEANRVLTVRWPMEENGED